MSARLWLDRLAEMLQSGRAEGLNDTHFPTLDYHNPGQLTEEEARIIEDLAGQFKSNRHLKRLLQFLFTKGKTFHIQNNFLNIHALVPSTADGDFEEFLGRKGKNLLNFIQDTIARVGDNYLGGKTQKEEDQALFFYLWCGPKSPFFG
jgi:fructose-1,6-bisphosphatase-3